WLNLHQPYIFARLGRLLRRELLVFSLTYFLGIDRLRYLNIVTSSVVFPSAGMLHAGRRTAALHLPATFITLREMLVAFRIGAVDHFRGNFSAVFAGRYDCRINRVDINGDTIIKNITFSFEIFTSGFLSVFNNSSVQLIYVLKTFF